MANQTQILNVRDEMKFDDNVQTDNVKEQEENVYSSSSDTTEELCSYSTTDACGDYRVATKEKLVEILYFRHFAKHFMFTAEGKNSRNKHLKNYFDVSVVVDIGCGNTNEK